MTDSDRLFDSRLSDRPGRGYPSCNTELCRIPRNRNDPGAYYAEIGVPPWSTEEEIRSRVRELYRRHHPDTGAFPDVNRLTRVRLIAEVLLDPESRELYNQTPPGKRLLDPLYRSELLDQLNLHTLDADELQSLLRPEKPRPVESPQVWLYDYLAVDEEPLDWLLAQYWYDSFVRVAPIFRYRRRIKILVHEGAPFFHHETGVMAVPRRWRPSSALAFAMFVVAAGFRIGVVT